MTKNKEIPVNDDRLLDKIRGCFFGIALGDALGMPAETMTHQAIMDATGGEGIRTCIASLPRKGRKSKHSRTLPAGTTTDDTQLTMAVARSLIKLGRFDLEDQARELVREFGDITLGWGTATERAAGRLKRWFDTAGVAGQHPANPAPVPTKPGQACGNGPAMKVAPLALFYPNNHRSQHEEPFLTHAMELGLQTHGDPRAGFASAAVGTVISMAIESGDVMERGEETQDIVMGHVSAAITALESRYQVYRPNEDCLSRRLNVAFANLGSAEVLRTEVGLSSFCLESVPFAIATFLRHPDDFRQGVLEAVNAGGDTDTNASMVGAMIGANVGLTRIGSDLLGGLKGTRHILSMADQFYGLVRRHY